MTGGYTQNPVISRITLALMEDTGWYRANYSLAQDLQWGAGLGCDFVKKSCGDWMNAQRSRCAVTTYRFAVRRSQNRNVVWRECRLLKVSSAQNFVQIKMSSAQNFVQITMWSACAIASLNPVHVHSYIDSIYNLRDCYKYRYYKNKN